MRASDPDEIGVNMKTGHLSLGKNFAIGLIATLVLASNAQSQQPAPGPGVLGPTVDHHFHLGSPALSAYVEQINKLDPSIFEHLSPEVFSKPTATTALKMLDQAGVERAVLISSGHLFLTGGKLADRAMEARELRDENRFVVDTALASHGRFIAFIDINPLDPNAENELAYWKGKPGVNGIKVHLGAAGFHASSPEQVATLARFFAEVRKAGLPLAVHLRGGGPFPQVEVETFIEKVLSQAGNLPVQIAHGGGYAGADPATIDSLSAFGAAIARKAPGTDNLVFDISGVVLPDETAKALGSSDAQLKLFVDLMRKIGLDRFVVGSDWPALGPIAPYYALMRRKLPLTDAEWAQLRGNQAPYLSKAR
jgi:predicted TIM-barrel fold metal-dependent hydrolase